MLRIRKKKFIKFQLNSKITPSGREGEKVMYYYPSAAETDDKIRRVGLAETVIRFASSFSKEKGVGDKNKNQ
jgi:hypothetical protein